MIDGKTLGVDATTLEANAALRSIVRRDTGESYESYLKELARKSGIEEPSRADIAKLDKKRPKKGSNKEWVNPNEPDAEIMKMKSGGTDMAHKAEHAVDMSGEGAVIAVTLHGGAKGDTKSLPDTLEKAQSNLQERANNAECCERIHEDAGREVVGDKGYHGNDILVELVEQEYRSYISEPERGGRKWKDKQAEQAATCVQFYSHTNYASKKVTGGFFFRNPNTRGGVFSIDGGKTLLIGDALMAAGTGSANCPTVAITDHVADPASLEQVFDDPNCFSFRERFPGGFTPNFGGEATDVSLVVGVRGFTAAGFVWDVSGSVGAHETGLFISDTVNASLGPDTPTAFDLGSNRQRETGVNFDVSYAATEMVNLAVGAEWRDEQYQTTEGHPTSWTVGPYGRGQGFSAGSNGFFGYEPLAAGTWNRSNVAVYGDLELNDPDDGWTLGAAVRVENFEDFGTTTNGKVSGRLGFVRASVSSGFRAPTPGQQNGFNIATIFDPALGDLVNNGTIPSNSPVAALRGGVPLRPETSINYTAGVVFDTGLFNFTADYFRIDVSDRIGITSNFTLENDEIDALLAQGVDAARDLKRFRFFTNAFATRSQGIDLVSTFTPIALRGQHRHQRRLQLHRHQGDQQRPGTAQRPAAHRVRLRAATDPLEYRPHPADGAHELPRPGQLLRRLVRLRQRIRQALHAIGRYRQRLLRRQAGRRSGVDH